MKYVVKQNILLAEVNKYLIDHPKIFSSFPKKFFIVPVDSNDQRYFRYSMKTINHAVKQREKNIIMAILSGENKWMFHKYLSA